MACGSPVRGSHAQLTWAGFWWDTGTDEEGVSYHAVEAWTKGSWCDYRGQGDASCRAFIIVFAQMIPRTVADPYRVGVAWDTLEWPTGPDAEWYDAGKDGAFALTYAGPTQ